MKITIEQNSITSILEDKEVEAIDEVMLLIRQSLLAIGFHPKTIIQGCEYIIEECGEK